MNVLIMMIMVTGPAKNHICPGYFVDVIQQLKLVITKQKLKLKLVNFNQKKRY